MDWRPNSHELNKWYSNYETQGKSTASRILAKQGLNYLTIQISKQRQLNYLVFSKREHVQLLQN